MDRSPVLWLVVGAGVGAAVTALLLHARDTPSCPPTTASLSPSPIPSPIPIPIPTPIPSLSPIPIPIPSPIPSPSASLSPIPPLDADPNAMDPDTLMRWRMHHHSVSTDDHWWNGLALDPAWDAPQLERVRARVVAELGHAIADDAVACRTRCCRIAMSEEDADRASDDLLSSVGLGFGAAGGTARSGALDGQVRLTACWSRDDPRPYPDRAAERTALLARAAPALATCSRGVTPALTVRLLLELDHNGEIMKLRSNTAEMGSAAATCAERALLDAATFAPAPEPTMVPITATIGA